MDCNRSDSPRDGGGGLEPRPPLGFGFTAGGIRGANDDLGLGGVSACFGVPPAVSRTCQISDFVSSGVLSRSSEYARFSKLFSLSFIFVVSSFSVTIVKSSDDTNGEPWLRGKVELFGVSSGGGGSSSEMFSGVDGSSL